MKLILIITLIPLCAWWVERALRNAVISAWAAAIAKGDMTPPGDGGPWRSTVATIAMARRSAARRVTAAWAFAAGAVAVAGLIGWLLPGVR